MKKTINLVSSIALLLVLSSCTTSEPPPSIDPAIIKSAAMAIPVGGLSCPLCAHNLDKQVMRVAGVSKAHVDLGSGMVYIESLTPYQLDLRAIENAIRDSGFTVFEASE